MILVASINKPLELTAKGSVRRNVCLADYAAEIDVIYKAAEDSAQAGPEPPASWTWDSTLEYVQAVVDAVMEEKVSPDEDLFAVGCDR